MFDLAEKDAVLWDILISSVIGIPILFMIYRKYTVGCREKWPKLRNCLQLFLLGAGSSAGVRWLLTLFGGFGYTEDVSALLTGNLFLETAVLLFFSPLFEELLFRGVIYERLKIRFSIRTAALVSALLFGMYHGNPTQGIYGFFMGLIFVWAMERFRTLAAPLMIHMGVNAAVLFWELANLL